MFKTKFIPLIVVALLCPLFNEVKAQVFIQSDHLEYFVTDFGNMVSDFPFPTIPPGFHPTESGFGVVSDVNRTEWSLTPNFPPYCGDYLAPGSPVDGFGVNIGGNFGVTYLNAVGLGRTDLNGSVTQVENGPGRYRYAVWETDGTTPIGLRITRLSFEDRQYIYTTVDFCNNTGADQSELYFGANWDPDNEQAWSGNYTTLNTVVSQTSLGDPLSTIKSEGVTYGCYMAAASADSRSKASYGSFATGDPYEMWTGGLPYTTAIAANTADEANQLSFNLGPMLNGECTCFSYVTVFLEGEFNDAVARLPMACSEVAALLAAPSEMPDTDFSAQTFPTERSPAGENPLVYPNPADQFATIDLTSFEGEISLQLINVAGQVVAERAAVQGGAQLYLPVSDLPAGIYTVQLLGKDFIEQASMVIR